MVSDKAKFLYIYAVKGSEIRSCGDGFVDENNMERWGNKKTDLQEANRFFYVRNSRFQIKR